MSNVVLGEQLAQFAYDHGGGLTAAIVLAEAMSWQGRGDEAESLLATFDPDGSDALATVRWGCTRAANLYWACGDVDSARSALAMVRDRVASPAMLGLVTAMEVSFDFFAGRLTQTISVGSAACAAPDQVPLAMVWVASATAGALALRGRFTEVPAIAQRGLAAAQRCESGLQRFAIGLAEVLALTAAGDFAAADQVCARYRDMTAGEAQANSIVDAMAGQRRSCPRRFDQRVRPTAQRTVGDGRGAPARLGHAGWPPGMLRPKPPAETPPRRQRRWARLKPLPAPRWPCSGPNLN